VTTMTEKKLFRAEVTKVVYLLADDLREAELEAESYADQDGSEAEILVSPVTGPGQVDPGWLEARPFGGPDEDGRTVREILEPEPPAPLADPPGQARFPWGPGGWGGRW